MDGTTSSGTINSFASFSTISTTSRSDSSKSNQGYTSNPVDRDYTKDNVASPIDMECHIQAERITKILDEAIYKTKLVLCLPKLVQEFKTLHDLLSPEHESDLLMIFGQYGMPIDSSSLVNFEAIEDIISGNMSLRNRLNPEIANMIYIMNSYSELKPKVMETLDMMKAGIQSKNEQSGLEYLSVLEQFREHMIVQMHAKAADELLAKINTKRLEAANDKLVKQIENFSQTLKQEQDQFEVSIAKKRDMIAKLQQEISLFHTESNLKLKKKVLDSDRQMVLASRKHEVKLDILKEDYAERKETYNNILQRHLKDETNHRLRRCKVETQILSWLQKYDMDMGDKQSELDDITEKYEDELKRIKELKEKLEEQDKEYIPLMAEREAEYQQEMLEKMTKFRREHAARVIQSAWRQVLETRAEKKKLKKLLKIAKEEADRESKRLEQFQAKAKEIRSKTKNKKAVHDEDDYDTFEDP